MDTNLLLTNDDLIQKLLSKEIKPYELDSLLGSARANEVRISMVESATNLKLVHLRKYSISPDNAKPNIENMIGAIQVPIGIAGPVLVKGDYAQGEFFLPVATTEGALTASINRGCSLINESGGASTSIIKSGQTRSILFRFEGIKEAGEFARWTETNDIKLKSIAEETSRFLEMKSISKYIIGNLVWLRLIGDTKDAMGMNMISLAAEAVGNYIQSNYLGARYVSTSGNICMDKKPSAINLIEGRGKTISAEVFLERDAVLRYLKATPESIVEVNQGKNLIGSALAGGYGFNANFANIIAGIFLATGQDIGHVVEGSHGFTTMELIDQKLHVMVTLSSLLVGTVGGGTHLETQRECLQILGVHGPGEPPGKNSSKFAEIVSAGVLAGELSLNAALAAKHLMAAHLRLNR